MRCRQFEHRLNQLLDQRVNPQLDRPLIDTQATAPAAVACWKTRHDILDRSSMATAAAAQVAPAASSTVALTRRRAPQVAVDSRLIAACLGILLARVGPSPSTGSSARSRSDRCGRRSQHAGLPASATRIKPTR